MNSSTGVLIFSHFPLVTVTCSNLELNPKELQVSGPPGSGFINKHKTLSSVFCRLNDLSLKTDIPYLNVLTVSNRQENLDKMFIFVGILKTTKEKRRIRSRNRVRIEISLTWNTVC
jgi:hypothetical protein